MSDKAITPVSGLIIERVAQLFQDEGYRARVESERMIESATNGFRFFIFVEIEGWLQFWLTIKAPDSFSLSECNDFNSRYRFARLYLDQDNDLVLTTDYFVGADSAAPTTQMALKEAIAAWDSVVGVLLRTNRERPKVVKKTTDLSNSSAA